MTPASDTARVDTAAVDTAPVDLVLAIADDNLIVAQRLGELISRSPDLEEDIAIANVSLDHLGQARSLYTRAGEIEGRGRDEDDLALGRDERDFRNAVLVEQPNGDFAQTMVRQFFLDAYQVPFYDALSSSTDESLAGIAAKAVKEARYHLERSSSWVVRLGDGTDESHQRTQAAVDTLWRYTGDLHERPAGGETVVNSGVAPDAEPIASTFDATVRSVLADATLDVPEDPYQRLGGRVGTHTEHLGHLLTEMQWLHRTHPGAQW